MMYRKLDESLITSEVCVQCGRCCKVTWTLPRWNQARRHDNNERIDRVPFMDVIFSSSPHSKVKGNDDKIAVTHWCPHLKQDAFCPDEEWDGNPTYKCSIYKDRPSYCSSYNCFTAANGLKRDPQYFEFIKGLIKKVHGKDPYQK